MMSADLVFAVGGQVDGLDFSIETEIGLSAGLAGDGGLGEFAILP
jgi:hypothetical protein